jgi:hypothetical protein
VIWPNQLSYTLGLHKYGHGSIPLTLHSLGFFGVRYVPYLLNEYVGVLRDASHSQNLGNVVDDNESTAETISK